jgi:hypothetical protein
LGITKLYYPRWDTKEGKGKDKKTTVIAQQSKYPRNHCNHCSIDGNNEEKCWKLHPYLNPKNRKKEGKKKNLLAKDSSNQVESSSDVDGNIVCTSMQKEVNLSNLHHQEEKEMNKLFHIKIQVKKTKIDVMLDSSSQDNLIASNRVNKIGLEVHNHPSPIHWVG